MVILLEVMLVAGLTRKQAGQKKSQLVDQQVSQYGRCCLPALIYSSFSPAFRSIRVAKATFIRPAVARLTEVNRRRNIMGLSLRVDAEWIAIILSTK